jgi:hypothetical protein
MGGIWKEVAVVYFKTLFLQFRGMFTENSKLRMELEVLPF